MKKIVVITSKFNIMNGDKYNAFKKNEKQRVDKEWIDNRIDIFMKFTAQSLMNQTNQKFFALYAYEDSTENLIFDALSNYEKLPDNIQFVKKSEYMNELDKITQGYDLLFRTNLDSDDLYKNNFVQNLYDFDLKEDTEEILCQNGYIYDSVNNRLGEYYHRSFTFYTFIYRLYKEEEKYSSLNINPWELMVNFSHFKTIDYKYEVLPGRNFIFMIHNQNTNSFFGTYNYDFYRIEKLIEDPQKKIDILYDFL